VTTTTQTAANKSRGAAKRARPITQPSATTSQGRQSRCGWRCKRPIDDPLAARTAAIMALAAKHQCQPFVSTRSVSRVHSEAISWQTGKWKGIRLTLGGSAAAGVPQRNHFDHHARQAAGRQLKLHAETAAGDNFPTSLAVRCNRELGEAHSSRRAGSESHSPGHHRRTPNTGHRICSASLQDGGILGPFQRSSGLGVRDNNHTDSSPQVARRSQARHSQSRSAQRQQAKAFSLAMAGAASGPWTTLWRPEQRR
jgi:hypothetical protein